MDPVFPEILRGLMENRQLTVRKLSRASRRAESTINQLLSGKVKPKLEILHDLAPAMGIPLEDLMVIAGTPATPPLSLATYPPTSEIGQIMAVASLLHPQQVQQLLETAKMLLAANEVDQ